MGGEMTFQQGPREQEFLEAVDARIAQVLARREQILPEASQLLSNVARHLCLTGHAKRARPLLTYYFGQALEVDPHKLIDAAAASELLHSASLLHDDVIDDAQMRRGNPSANANWSNSVAVLSGNYLLYVAFDLLRDYPVELTRDGVNVIGQMTKAAIAEIEIRGRDLVDVSLWREIAIGKTGALFGMCGLAAARINHDESAASRIIRCANHIGVIFQMTDDIIDITDTSGLKDRYSDILNKEPSLPLITASKNETFRAALKTAWSKEEVSLEVARMLGQMVIECGAIEETKTLIKQEAEALYDCLGNLAHTAGGKHIVTWLQHLSQIKVVPNCK